MRECEGERGKVLEELEVTMKGTRKVTWKSSASPLLRCELVESASPHQQAP